MARSKARRKRSNRTGGLYLRNGNWVGQWVEGEDRRTKTFGPDRLSAETDLKIILARVAAGRPGLDADPRAGGTMGGIVEAWLGQRSNRNADGDEKRWKHWAEHISDLGPDEVTVAVVKSCFVKFRAKGLSNSSIRHCAVLLSSIYGDLVEEGRAKANPIAQLAEKTRDEWLRPEHDPKKVPYVREPGDVARIYAWLSQRCPSVAIAYAIGALAGLRTSEVRALSWDKIDLQARTIAVEVQVQRTNGKKKRGQLTADGLDQVKDGEARIVPILDALYPILEAHQGEGLVCPPMRGRTLYSKLGRSRRFIGERLLNRKLRAALVALGIEPGLLTYDMCWYAGTRHTFASQWVLHGGSLEKLKEFLGHSSVAVTERYAHLQPGRFTDEDRGRVKISLPGPEAPEVEVSESIQSLAVN